MSPLNRRIEDGPEAIALDNLERLGPELRRKVNEVVLGQSLHLVGGRGGWGRPVLKMIIPREKSTWSPRFRSTTWPSSSQHATLSFELTRPGKNAVEAVVALVTRVLEDRSIGAP